MSTQPAAGHGSRRLVAAALRGYRGRPLPRGCLVLVGVARRCRFCNQPAEPLHLARLIDCRGSCAWCCRPCASGGTPRIVRSSLGPEHVPELRWDGEEAEVFAPDPVMIWRQRSHPLLIRRTAEDDDRRGQFVASVLERLRTPDHSR